MHSQSVINELEGKALLIRRGILEIMAGGKKGHLGGSMSIADIIAALYFHQMRLDPKNPDWEDRDHFVMSKGHSVLAQYVALAELGYFPKEELRKVGESNEGMIWEAAIFAAHHKLDNLTAMTDQNRLMASGRTILGSLAPKWRAFGWEVFEINGHDVGEILDALDNAASIEGQPTMMICHTIKGRGVSFAEDVSSFHHCGLTQEQYERARKDLQSWR